MIKKNQFSTQIKSKLAEDDVKPGTDGPGTGTGGSGTGGSGSGSGGEGGGTK